MKILVNTHIMEIKKEIINEKEINITKCEFEFAKEITDEFVKEVYFTINGNSYKQIISNNQCDIPYEVLEQAGQIEIGVVAYLIENEEYVKRYNPRPVFINSLYGSLKENVKNSQPITPTEMEQFEQQLENGLNEVANVNINAEQTSTGSNITITDRDGISKTVYVYNGEKGEQGIPGKDGQSGIPGANGKDGQDGADATINGVNTLTLKAGDNITLEQKGSTMTISATGGSGGTSDYENLDNLPTINNVELIGNKTTSDLGLQDALVSGNNIKTINNQSLLGSGDIDTNLVILSYGNSTWQEFIDAYKSNKIVYCRAGSTSQTPGNQTRLAFMAYVNNETNPTMVEFQYYRSVSSHTSSSPTDQVIIYRLDKGATGWSIQTRQNGLKVQAGTNISSNISDETLTLNLNLTTITGYDATKTQTLKNVNGTLKWITD